LRFYALALGVVLVTLGISGVMINFKPILADAGIAPERAAWIAGAVGLSVVAGRLVTGFLVDRYWAPGVACVLLVLPAASCWILPPADLTVAMALTAGLLIGLATGAEGDLMPFLTVKYLACGITVGSMPCCSRFSLPHPGLPRSSPAACSTSSAATSRR
jgi:MFS family permease